MISDYATFAYIGDVFVLEAHRGRGLSKRLMEAIVGHPELQGLRRWMLATRDAHGLYAQYGFTPLATPDRIMERHTPNAYVPVDAMQPVSDLGALLRTMKPVLNPGVVVFCVLPDHTDAVSVPAIGLFREPEGITVIIEEHVAEALGLEPVYRAAWITLTVHSDLAAVGLTAAVSRALADAGISCNVVAAVHHDHLFVPAEQGEAALQALVRLSTVK